MQRLLSIFVERQSMLGNKAYIINVLKDISLDFIRL